MPLDRELTRLMHDTVTLELRMGVDKFNNFLFGSPFTAQCKISKDNRRVLDAEGRETTSTVQIIFADPTIGITVDSRLTLPDGTKPAILEVLGSADETGSPYWLEIRA